MDYAVEIIEILKVGFSDIVTNCVNVAAAVLPIGLGLLGLGKIWDVAKRFFNKSVGDDDADFRHWMEDNRNKDYDING